MAFAPVITTKPTTLIDFFDRHGSQRADYIEGQVVPLPSVSHNHQLIVDNLIRALTPQITEGYLCALHRETLVGNAPVDAYAIQGVFTTPDLVMTRGPADYYYPPSHALPSQPDPGGKHRALRTPRVVLDVLMPEEHAHVTGPRFTALRRWLDASSFQEYVLIAAGWADVARYRRQGQDWSVEVWHDFDDVVSLSRVGCAVMLGEIYSRVRDRVGRPLVRPVV